MDHPLNLLIRQMRWEADNVLSFLLVDSTGAELPHWDFGAHVDVEIAPGIVRQYSLCGDYDDLHAWRIAVLREDDGTGGSRTLHNSFRPGMTVAVRGPRSNFPLVANANRYLFIAGGIGITPILPMITYTANHGAPWNLLYGGRRRSSMAFLGELEQFGEQVVAVPQDELGLLDLERSIMELDSNTEIYCCGPEPLIAAVKASCVRHERPKPHIERFTRVASTVNSLASHPFEIVLKDSELTLNVPIDQSILEVVEEAGVMAFSSCREGYCVPVKLQSSPASQITEMNISVMRNAKLGTRS